MRFEELEQWIKEKSIEYYAGRPTVSDKEFDKAVLELRSLETDDRRSKVLSKIYSDHAKGFSLLKHDTPMYSMQDVFTIEEMGEWFNSLPKNTKVIAEYKFDGLSLNLIYEDGKLLHALTRGDGEKGDDVTVNTIGLATIPKKIKYKKRIEVRGELVMPFSAFEKNNKYLKSHGEKTLSNPRNAASGAIKSHSPLVAAQRGLEFHPWDIIGHKHTLKTRTQTLAYIKSLGFLESPYEVIEDIKQLKELYSTVSSSRETLDYPIDGLAIKIDDLSVCRDLGVTGKYPKYSRAFKFIDKEQETTIEDILFQVGRTGTITPVAVVSEVNIDGALVTRATLHNFDEVKRLGIKIGAIVAIVRSGGVIPKVNRVVRYKDGATDVCIPTNCPCCNEKLVDSMCVNIKCKDRIIATIKHVTSRDRLYIKGLGQSIIKELVSIGIVETIADIFRLDEEDLSFMSSKMADKLLNAIEVSRNVSMDRVISSLCVNNVGRILGKKIAERFGMESLSVSVDDLCTIDGISRETAVNLVHAIKYDEDIKDFISVINIEWESKDNNDFSIVLTGEMSLPRAQIVDRLSKLGIAVESNVTKNTNALVYAGDTTSGKYKKATKLGLVMLSVSGIPSDKLIDEIASIKDSPF